MPALLLYLLKVNVALVLFYMAYHVALRRLTFYHLNRLFLLFGIVFSTVYPFIDLSELFADNEKITNTYMATIPAWVITAQTTAPSPELFDFWQLPVYLFWAGVVVMFVRFILQFVSLYKIHAASEPATYNSIGFRKVKSISQAFSFWQTIYINPAKHKSEELESILRHELIHITGWHTLDVMLVELSTVFYWFNPGAWLMKKAVKENLEFIADQNVVNTGVDKKEYQYLLLKVVGATQPQIANQFIFPSLKRRIAMMNKIPTHKANRLRLLIALPLVAVLLVAFRSSSEPLDNIVNKVTSAGMSQMNADADNQVLTEDYKDFFRRNPTVMEINWIPDDLTGNGKKIKRVLIVQRSTMENFLLEQESSMARLNDKFGKLPAIPTEPSNNIRFKNPAFTETNKQEEPDAYKAFYERNSDVKGLSWRSNNKIVVTLKSGVEESYTFGDKKSMTKLETKYGKLPSAPPVVKRDQSSKSPLQDNEEIIFPTDIDYYQNKENLPANYRNFLKRNPTVEKVGWKINGNTEPQVVVIRLRSGETETYDMKNAKSLTAAESKYGKLPDLLPPPPPPPPVPAANEPAPPVPPAPPADEQLPPPPPPVRHDGPLIPGTGAKLVEDEKTITYVLWPGETTRREFEVAKNAFKESGFDLSFDQKYDGEKLVGIKITLKSDRKGSNANAVYNTNNLDGLKESNNVIVVKANKKTGELIVGSTIAEK